MGQADGGSVSRQSSGNRHNMTERSGRAKARPLPIFRSGIGEGEMMAEQGTLRQAFDAHRKHIASTGSASTKASKARAMNLLQHVLKEDMDLTCTHFFSPGHAVSVKERLRAAFTKGTFGRAEASVKQRVSQLRMAFIGMGASEAWINTVFLPPSELYRELSFKPSASMLYTDFNLQRLLCQMLSVLHGESAIQYATNRSAPTSSPSSRVLTRNLAALSIIVLFCRRPGTLVHMSVDDLGLDGGPLRLHDEYGSKTDVHAEGARSKVVHHFIAEMAQAWGSDLPSKPFIGASEYSTFFRAVMISAGLRPNESDQFRPYAFRQAASTFDMGDVRTMLEELPFLRHVTPWGEEEADKPSPFPTFAHKHVDNTSETDALEMKVDALTAEVTRLSRIVEAGREDNAMLRDALQELKSSFNAVQASTDLRSQSER